jgi:hypothetical protein
MEGVALSVARIILTIVNSKKVGISGCLSTACVTPGFKDKPECKNTCAPGSSYTHASTQ